MDRPARADLESLLRARQLDVTLTSNRPDPGSCADGVVPFGLAGLDAALGGGLPRGQLSEVVGPRSSGRTSLLVRLLATATRAGELTALVDTFDNFDPDSAVAAGIELSRLLWIRGRAVRSEPLGDDAVSRAVKALHLVLQAGGFRVVALDLAEAPEASLRRLPFTTWLRVQRAIEGSQAAGLLVAAIPTARGPAGATIALRPVAPVGRWTRGGDRDRLFDGLETRAQIARSRFRPDEARPITLQFGTTKTG